jgi:uncharacterized sodium:solute symporter family permease YidK
MQSDVLLAMIICGLFLQDVPMDYKSKVILCVLIMKYIDTYVKTEADLIWVNKQLKQMELEQSNAIRGSDTVERNRTSHEEVL